MFLISLVIVSTIFWILSNGNAALFDIRAGDIDLQHIYRLVCKTIYHFNIFLCGMSAYIDNNLCIILF